KRAQRLVGLQIPERGGVLAAVGPCENSAGRMKSDGANLDVRNRQRAFFRAGRRVPELQLTGKADLATVNALDLHARSGQEFAVRVESQLLDEPRIRRELG